MSKMSLHERTCRLAATNGGIRLALVQIMARLSLADRAIIATGGDPDLLKAVDAVIKAASGNTSIIQQPPIVIQQAPIVVQQEAPAQMMPAPVAPQPPQAPVYPTTPRPESTPLGSPNTSLTQTPAANPSPLGMLLVTERTQKGFESDLLPEMERLLAQGQGRPQIVEEVLGMIRAAFQKKEMLYNILIRHQSTFESDTEYRESLERLVEVWAHTTDDGG